MCFCLDEKRLYVHINTIKICSAQLVHSMAESGAAAAPLFLQTSFLEKFLDRKQSNHNTCFDFFATFWVFGMEKMIPSIHKEVHQTEIMDNLQKTRSKMQLRKQELTQRLQDVLIEAKKLQRKRDVRALKNRILSAQRIKNQLQNIDNAILIMENNIDHILNNEVQRDMVASMQQATYAMKTQVMDIGGPESISEMMIDLDTEMRNQKEITDALSKPPYTMNDMLPSTSSNGAFDGDDEEESLKKELALLLEDDLEEAEDNHNVVDNVCASAALSMETISLNDHPSTMTGVVKLKQRKQLNNSADADDTSSSQHQQLGSLIAN